MPGEPGMSETSHGPAQAAYLTYRRARTVAKHALQTMRRVVSRKTLEASVLQSASAVGNGVLIVEQSLPATDRNAGSRNIFMFAETLANDGIPVFYWPQDNSEDPKYARPLAEVGVHVVSGAGRPGLTGWLREHRRMIGSVLLCRPDVGFEYLPSVRRAAAGPIIYYGHDLHYARLQMQAEVENDRTMMAGATRMRHVEEWLWGKADVVVYPTAEEVSVVSRRCPDRPALPVTIYCFDRFVRLDHIAQGKNLLFVGGFSHAPNIDGALWLVDSIFPLIQRDEPDATLTIIGSNAPPEILGIRRAGVTVLGSVSDEALAQAYETARVAVVPLRFGAGLKLKVVEALAKGVPVVTTPVGAQGLSHDANILDVTDDAPSFARRTLDVLRLTDTDWLARSHSGTAYAERNFSRQTMRRTLHDALNAAQNVHRRALHSAPFRTPSEPS